MCFAYYFLLYCLPFSPILLINTNAFSNGFACDLSLVFCWDCYLGDIVGIPRKVWLNHCLTGEKITYNMRINCSQRIFIHH